MATSYFNEIFYLESKLAQLQRTGETQFTSVVQVRDAILAAGFATVRDHFNLYSLEEGTNPNRFFNTQEYLEAKAAQLNEAEGTTTYTANSVAIALAEAGYTNAYDHYVQWGWAEGINPSNAFDTDIYFVEKAAESGLTVDEVKAAFVAAGLDPITHYELYGRSEGLTAPPVPPEDQVVSDPNAGSSYRLTPEVDTAAANFFDGSSTITAAGRTSTLENGDQLTGTGDNPTLYVEPVNFVPTTVTPRSLTGIETIELEGGFAGAGYTLNTRNADAVTNLTFSNFANAVNITNLATAISEIDLTNMTSTVNVRSLASALSGVEDAIALTVNGVAGMTLDIQSATPGGAGYELIDITSSGNIANSFALTDNDLETLTVQGTQDLQITNALSNSATVIDAGGNEDAGVAAFAGMLMVTVGANDTTITGGDGNDRVAFGANYNDNDTYDGGDGRNTLASNFVQLEAINAETTGLTNIQILETNGGTANDTLRADLFGDAIDTVLFTGSTVGVGDYTVRMNAGESTVVVQTATVAGVGNTLFVEGGTGEADTLTLALDGEGTGVSTVGNLSLTSATRSIEQLAITSNDGFGGAHTIGAIVLPNTAGDNVITISGDTDLDIGAVSANKVDASGLTSGARLDMTALATRAIEVTGSGGGDDLRGSAQNDVLSGGAGDDILRGGNEGDTLSGGAGDDIFFYNAVTQSTGPTYDSITDMNFGGDGTLPVDTIRVGGSPTAIDDAVTTGALSVATFNVDLAAAIGATELGINNAVLFTASAGDLSGRTFLVIDDNATAGYQGNADYVIEVTGFTGTLDTTDIV